MRYNPAASHFSSYFSGFPRHAITRHTVAHPLYASAWASGQFSETLGRLCCLFFILQLDDLNQLQKDHYKVLNFIT